MYCGKVIFTILGFDKSELKNEFIIETKRNRAILTEIGWMILKTLVKS